ncbi:hypothetical protein HNV12_26800 [Methanococcoides sp. SA1]|nr:hypothetical protein [Methanococcoides sp. SA1]
MAGKRMMYVGIGSTHPGFGNEEYGISPHVMKTCYNPHVWAVNFHQRGQYVSSFE